MKKPIEILTLLKYILDPSSEKLRQEVVKVCRQNPWFLEDQYMLAIENIRTSLLDESILLHERAKYPEVMEPKKIGLVLAGNIPLVGIHDIICVILSGHHLKVKLSEKDKAVYKYVLSELHHHIPETIEQYQVVDKLKNFDAIIATGSNNSGRYFEHYFGKYPNIIRKNRNGIAVLNGSETAKDLIQLGKDIFLFFGLGCRSVSKLYIPQGYDFVPLLDHLKTYQSVIDHSKYRNNYDYNLSLQILNGKHYLSNENLLFLQEEMIASRIATVHFEYYDSPKNLLHKLQSKQNEIQCILANQTFASIPTFKFGQSQNPKFTDYADEIDTLEFLTKLG